MLVVLMRRHSDVGPNQIFQESVGEHLYPAGAVNFANSAILSLPAASASLVYLNGIFSIRSRIRSNSLHMSSILALAFFAAFAAFFSALFDGFFLGVLASTSLFGSGVALTFSAFGVSVGG